MTFNRQNIKTIETREIKKILIGKSISETT